MAELGQYATVMLVAQRSAQLRKGAKPRVETKHVKQASIALEEVIAGKVEYHEVEPQEEGAEEEQAEEEREDKG